MIIIMKMIIVFTGLSIIMMIMIVITGLSHNNGDNDDDN